MENTNAGNISPTPLVKKYAETAPRGYALDLGSGRGTDALYLTKQNFKVTAVDKNKQSIEKLKNDSGNQGLSLEAINQDIKDVSIQKNYFSFICAINSLNFLSKKEFLETIEKIKSGLKDDGIGVIILFTNEDSLYQEIKKTAKTEDGESFYDDLGRRWYYPPKNLLKNLFENDTEVLFYVEAVIEDKFGHAGNEMPHTHSIARIAIKKKRLV